MTSAYKIPRLFFLFSLFVMTFTGCEILASSLLIKYNHQCAYFIPFCLFGAILLFILFLPIKPLNIFSKINKNHFIKLILSLYIILFIISIFGYCSLLLNEWFYYETPLYIFLFIFTLTILILGHSTTFNFYFAFFIGLLIFIFNLFPLFNTTHRAFSTILPLNLKITDFLSIVSCLFLVLDVLIFLPFNQNLKRPITKKHLIITMFCAMIFWTLLISDNYFFLFPDILKNTVNAGLVKYEIYTISLYIDNLESILLFNIFFIVIIKSSILINILRLIHGVNKNIVFSLSFGIIIIIFSHYLVRYNKNILQAGRIIGLILTGCMLIYYFFLQVIYRKKQIYHDKVKYE